MDGSVTMVARTVCARLALPSNWLGATMRQWATSRLPQRFPEQESPELTGQRFDATEALPGTPEKVDVLGRRIRQGLPLWHPADRQLQPMIEEPRPPTV
jgi:hypothetical protein